MAPISRSLAPLAFQDFGYAEPAADLDEFAARDDHFRLLGREMAQDEHQRRRAIVDHGGGFGAAQQRQVMFEVSGAPATFAAAQVILEVAIIGGDGARAFRPRPSRAENVRDWCGPKMPVPLISG